MTAKLPLTAEEAAQLLKVSKYTLYELIKRGELPAQRVGRQIRINPDSLELYLHGKLQDPSPAHSHPGDTAAHQPESHPRIRFYGSHDPVIELLTEFLKHSVSPVSLVPIFDGSMEGLIALYKRKADLAGVHLWDEQTGEYNLPFIRYVLPGEPVAVITLMERVQGWIVPTGNPLQLAAWEDIRKDGLRFINRQKGSGTRLRLDSYLRSAGISPASIDGYETEENTHFGIACRVANGEASAGIGVQSAATRMGLEFVPLFKERYDLVCLEQTARTPEWKQIESLLQSSAFQNALHNQGGYETALTGTYIHGGELK